MHEECLDQVDQAVDQKQAMIPNATWLTRQERVQILCAEHESEGRKKVSHFFVLTERGTTDRVNRNDILLDEEEGMIRELVGLLSDGSRSKKFARYFIIMRELMDRGVPYAGSLRKYLNERPVQQSFNLNDAS